MSYRLEDLIDISLLQNLQERLDVIYSFPSAIIDNEGKVLTAVAWQDICTKFHRLNPECSKECIESDKYILEHISEANPAVSYGCPHGLIDNATPIVIDGRHMGNFFTGQFFLEKPDLEFFRKQAKKYGFDEKSYLEAVDKVPVWSKEKLAQYLDFIKGFIEIIAGLGYKNLKAIETNRALKESELKYSELFHRSPDSISLHRMLFDNDNKPVDYCIIDVNEGFENILNVRKEDVIGAKASQVFPSDELNRLLDIFAPIAINGGSSKYDFFSESNNKYFEGVAFSTQKSHFATIFRDVTSQKNAANELISTIEKAEGMSQRLQLALSSGQFGIWDWNVKDNIIVWDERMFELYGTRNQMSANTIDIWANAVHPEDKLRVINECNAALIGEKDFDTTFRVVHPDGKVLYLKSEGLVIRDENNIPARMLGINRNVTKQELTKSELIKAKEKAEESDKLKTAFLRNISHEVRTPLNAIVGFSSIIAERTYSDEKLQNYAKMIALGSDKLIGIIMDVIEVSQLEVSRNNVNLAEIKLLSLTSKILGPFYDKLNKTDVELKVHMRHVDEKTTLLTDELKLHKIIHHLVDNAFKFTERGSITINIELVNENLRIIVSDTGIGIGEKHQQYIFEPFRQVETEIHKNYGGLGLGLTLVKSYVEILKGNLSFKSENGKGTKVTVQLPLKVLSQHQTSSKPVNHLGFIPVPTQQERGIILIAEDDMNSFIFLKEVFASENITALHACNGQTAVDISKSNPDIKLVLMDIKMPLMDGITAARQIRMTRPELPIIAQTAYADSINNELDIHYFDDCIAKPASITAIKSLIFKYV